MAGARFMLSDAESVRLHAKLTEWWNVLSSLTSKSTDQEWNKFASYLSPSCTIYFSGMAVAPSHGRDGAVSAVKALLGYWSIKEHRVMVEGTGRKDRVILAVMSNKLGIKEQDVEFPETEVVTYDESDLIVDYKLYADPAPIRDVFQRIGASG